MRRIAFALLVAAAALLGPGAAADLFKNPSPNLVIFPRQRLPLSFSHADHLIRDKLNCAFCHDDAETSKRAADHLIPPEAACKTCHEIERDKPNKQVPPGKPDAKCDSCHPGFTGQGEIARVIVPPPNLKFNHQVHVDRKIRCQLCHGDLAAQKTDLATRDNLPRMPFCLRCHDGKTAPSKCTTCHLAEPGGFVKTGFAEGRLLPSGVLRGDAHDPKFRTEHSRVAGNDERYCENCHRREFCIGCHDGVVKPLDFHGGDYVSMHPIDARRNNPDCGACHRRQTFCAGCHARSGVSLDHRDPGTQRLSDFEPHAADEPGRGSLGFHPPGYVVFQNDKVSGHTIDAQRNIRACAGCHEEDFCIECHGRRGRRIDSPTNPHPKGFASSPRCRALAKRAGRMCIRCHNPSSDSIAVRGCL